jgi:hypothetical protein
MARWRSEKPSTETASVELIEYTYKGLPAESITIAPDGLISMDFHMRPEVYAMLLKYKSVKETKDIPLENTVNNILNDFFLERLSKPTGFKSLKPLDAFDLEKGK